MLELPRIEDVAWRLRLPMSAPIQFRSSGKLERADTCREALSTLQRGLLLASDQDVPAANFELTTCRAVALLGSARPATRSYLGDVAMSPPSARWLPPTLAAAPDAEAMRALQAAEAQGLMLAQLPGPLRLGTYGGALVVNDGRTETGLFELARGDFDGDGTEDLLVSVMERTLDNRFENTRLYLLTRSAADAPLRVTRRIH